MLFHRCIPTIAGLALGTHALGADIPVELHGFASQGYLKSNRDNYLGQSQSGSPEFNEFGVNASKSVGSNLRVGLQLFARDLGSLGDDRVTLDWAYGDYRWRDWLGVRLGRIRQPSGLYNETRDIDLARVSVLLPQSVYPENYRDVLSSYNGGCLYGQVPLGPVGALNYELFAGGNNIDQHSSVAQSVDDSGAVTIDDVRVKYDCGASAIWDAPLPGLRVGATWTRLALVYRGTTTAFPPFVASQPIEFDAHRIDLVTTSLEYSRGDLVLSAEALRINGRIDSPTPGIPATKVNQGGWYAGFEYRITPHVELGSYYSEFYPDTPHYSSHDANAHQRDLAATVRFDITDYWLVKLEGHWIRGTAQLLQQENQGPGGPLAPKQADADWLLFAAKTTLSF